MSAEELLKEAQRRFPIGTQFKDVISDKNVYTLKKFDVANKEGWTTYEHIIVWCENLTGCGKYLYKRGVWAKKLNNNVYQIY